MTTHTIPFERLTELQNRVADLNSRARKLEMPELTLATSAPRSIERSTEHVGITRTVWVVDVEITGAAPVINGSVFVAMLEHHEGGNLIAKSLAFQDRDLSAWHHAGPRCQHCGLDRDRGVTYLVETEGASERGLVQIGSSCAEDYLRSENAAAALRIMRLWGELMGGLDFDGEDGFGFGGFCPTPTPLEYVAAAVGSVRRNGFAKADREERSTRADVDLITGKPPAGGSSRLEAWKAAQPTSEDRARAVLIVAWLAATRDPSDYMHNLRTAIQDRIVGSRSRGLLASAPSAYDRHLADLARRSGAVANPGHFGAEKDKFTAEVIVIERARFNSDFGPKTMFLMRDTAGHLFRWYTAGQDGEISDTSGVWFLSGTVKKHESDRKTNEPVTTITRGCLNRQAPVTKPARKARARKEKITAAA